MGIGAGDLRFAKGRVAGRSSLICERPEIAKIQSVYRGPGFQDCGGYVAFFGETNRTVSMTGFTQSQLACLKFADIQN
jgi:hypothetical protein